MADEQLMLLSEAKRIRESGIFGRSERVIQTFDILVSAARAGRAIKEVELANAVFQNDVRLQSGLDSSVRALIHRLRRKLDEFYSIHGPVDNMRLDIPKGSYILQFTAVTDPLEEERLRTQAILRDKLTLFLTSSKSLLGLCAVLVAALAALSILYFTKPNPLDETELWRLKELRTTSLWSELLRSNKPSIVVVGTPRTFPDEPAGPYVPLAISASIRNISPLLYVDAGNHRFMTIMQADRLQPEMVRANNIIFIGRAQDLGPQLEHIWSGIRILTTPDGTAIVDQETGNTYPTTIPTDSATSTHTEYALLASMNGPDGNRILLIAGSGHAAIAQAASLAIDQDALRDIARKTKGALNFEALFAVRAHGAAHQGAELLVATPLSDAPWGNSIADELPVSKAPNA